MHQATGVRFADDHDAPSQTAVEQEQQADGEADQHAQQQVGEHDGDDRDHERDELRPPILPHLTEQGGVGELEAGHHEDGGQCGQRNAVQQRGKQEHAHHQQHAMGDGGEARACASVGVDRASHDDRRHGHAADQSSRQIADALRQQFAVRRRDASLRIQLVRGFQIQQRFKAGHDRQRSCRHIHLRIGDLREIRKAEDGVPSLTLGTQHRHRHQVRFGDGPGHARHAHDFVDRHAQQHGRERCREQALLQTASIPCQQHSQTQQADDRGAGQEIAEGTREFAECGLPVGLDEGHLAFVVGVVTHEVWQLLQDQDHADGCQQTLDDVVGEVVRQHARTQHAQPHLQDAAEREGEQEGLEGTQDLELRQHDGGESGGRARDADVRSAEQAHQDAAEDSGDDAGDDGHAGCVGDAKAQRHRHEKHDDACEQVAADGLKGAWYGAWRVHFGSVPKCGRGRGTSVMAQRDL